MDKLVIFEEMPGKGGDIGLITLNRPNALNALTYEMIQLLQTQLTQWAVAPQIKAVIIRAVEGRAFCAGGDLRSLYENIKNHHPGVLQFFRHEYQLNRFIFHFPKPYIALLDGITMGGGAGISIHGSHRVVTDNLLFAMPETGIGFFPDVGSTYFLPRLPGKIGFYLGLTGARLKSDDCIALGLAQHKVPRESFAELIQTLAQQPFEKEANHTVTQIIKSFACSVNSSCSLLEQQAAIDGCFSGETMEAIFQASSHSSNTRCKEAALEMAKKSPTSLKVTLKALEVGRTLTFDQCMQQEYRLVSHFLQAHDLLEGIRAVIIDKDQTPHWKPDNLQQITLEEVNNYFAPVAEELV